MNALQASENLLRRFDKRRHSLFRYVRGFITKKLRIFAPQI
jgi:hypothetical protein